VDYLLDLLKQMISSKMRAVDLNPVKCWKIWHHYAHPYKIRPHFLWDLDIEKNISLADLYFKICGDRKRSLNASHNEPKCRSRCLAEAQAILPLVRSLRPWTTPTLQYWCRWRWCCSPSHGDRSIYWHTKTESAVALVVFCYKWYITSGRRDLNSQVGAVVTSETDADRDCL